MKRDSSRSWWSSVDIGASAQPPDTDYAGLGTAFGLDASLAPPASGRDNPPEPGAAADDAGPDPEAPGG